MANAIVEKAKERMTQSHQSLAREFGSIRAGRANASLLDRITVEYYGVETPLNQIASITIPEARVLLVTPFDKSSIKDIERALNASDLGITPASDGSVIRLVIPALTEETRRDLAKEVKKLERMLRLLSGISAVMLWMKRKSKKKQKKLLKMN
ncbi:Ribosome recycling factor [Streptococcus constellatus]|nr:Ribosome recycling factor [Streptococcus constellatus]